MDINSRCLTHNYSWLASKIITPISIFTKIDGEKGLKTTALRDTWATLCAIHWKVAEKMWLIPLGKRPIWWVHGRQDANFYIVDIVLENWVKVIDLNVIECNTTEWFIIGMNVISLWDLCISNHQWKTTMTFVCPSQKRTDYVAEWNIKHKSKIPSPTIIHQSKKKKRK